LEVDVSGGNFDGQRLVLSGLLDSVGVVSGGNFNGVGVGEYNFRFIILTSIFRSVSGFSRDIRIRGFRHDSVFLNIFVGVHGVSSRTSETGQRTID